MKRLLLLTIGLVLVLSGGYVFAQRDGQAALRERSDQLRRQSTALAWPAENVTRLNLGSALPLGAQSAHTHPSTRKGPSHPAAPTYIGWNTWLAVPSEIRWRMFHQNTPHARAVRSLVVLEVLAVPVLLGFLLYQPLVNGRLGRLRPSTVKGSARWLSRAEIRALRPRAGEAPLVLGRAGHHLVALPEAEVYQNTLVVGPPGSGKSASLFIPPLLEERGRRSLVVVDPKNELIERTYAAASRHHDVAILNFLDPGVSIAYNPLAQVTDALSANFFADAWVRNTGTSSEDFWNDTAKQLIAAAALHLTTALAKDGGATLNDLALFLTNQEPDEILQAFHDSLSAEARRMGEQFLKSMQHNQRLLGSIFTVLHAIRKVEGEDALVTEGRRLIADVLPFVDEPTQRGVAGAVPLKAVSRTLVHALQDTILLRDLHAVRAYVCGTLLGRERVPAVQVAWGLQVVGAQPRVRAVVEEVLGLCGLAAYRGLIDLQLQRMGER